MSTLNAKGRVEMGRLKRRDRAIAASIVVLALLLRLLASWQLAQGAAAVYRPSPATDMATYWTLSTEILAGRFSGEFYYQPFYYAVWLPALRLICDSVNTVIIAQAALGAAAVFLTILTGRAVGGRRAGYLAGILTCFCAPLLLYTPFLIIANIQTFWIALIAFAGCRLLNSGRTRYYCLLSLALGLAVLTRGNAWYIFPGAAALCFFVYGGWRGGAAAVGMFASVLLLQLPFSWHNTALRGELAGPSTASGQVLALGNTPEAPPGGRDFNTMAGPMEYPRSFYLWMERAAEVPVALQILEWARREPMAFAELQFRKLLLFWDWRDIPNNVALYGEGAASFVVKLSLVPGAILALALAGVFSMWKRAWRRRRAQWFYLVYLLAGYWAATAAFYNLSRFRAPILPVAAVVGACFAVTAVRRFKLNRRGFYAACLPPLAAAVFAVFSGYDFYTGYCEAAVMRVARPDGVAAGDWERDNGPASFGGWDVLAVSRGDTVVKKLKNASGPGEAVIRVAAGPGGRMSLKSGGKLYRIGRAENGEAAIRIPVADRSDWSFEVAEVFESALVFDRQRDYGRTFVNGVPVPGELVAEAGPYSGE